MPDPLPRSCSRASPKAAVDCRPRAGPQPPRADPGRANRARPASDGFIPPSIHRLGPPQHKAASPASPTRHRSRFHHHRVSGVLSRTMGRGVVGKARNRVTPVFRRVCSRMDHDRSVLSCPPCHRPHRLTNPAIDSVSRQLPLPPQPVPPCALPPSYSAGPSSASLCWTFRRLPPRPPSRRLPRPSVGTATTQPRAGSLRYQRRKQPDSSRGPRSKSGAAT
jgi:hypothetical protein